MSGDLLNLPTHLRAVVLTLFWRFRYEDSNPDVGCFPYLPNMLAEIEEECYLTFTGQETELITQTVERMLKK